MLYNVCILGFECLEYYPWCDYPSERHFQVHILNPLPLAYRKIVHELCINDWKAVKYILRLLSVLYLNTMNRCSRHENMRNNIKDISARKYFRFHFETCIHDIYDFSFSPSNMFFYFYLFLIIWFLYDKIRFQWFIIILSVSYKIKRKLLYGIVFNKIAKLP